MIQFTALLQKFDQKGEKTGWTYIEIPAYVTDALSPGRRTSFRVKGQLDNLAIRLVALLPMGKNGDSDAAFIMPINADMRRSIRKEAGVSVQVELAIDTDPLPVSDDLLACLADEPAALAFFQTLPKSHQVYYSNWVEEAKSIDTKTKRIAQAVTGMAMGLGYGEMIRYFRKQKAD
ncbi:YdeI/OmpD-associated family protein [Spirosoma montaniterrae]|uniref:DUF1905 domain-containing protein n=1 Tax=Spirosoma montaniterrae TaxID=1178516 RepID=A0A1P9WS07_9BACT|nr:YdeI/OmpD-associated family protein [Spirosoma montaniterrae]AQG78166.1 hypothetical protein AWR27_01665 [Spirosoma montaniterrae]